MTQFTDFVEILTTNDGSHTLKNRISGETYHSIHGAVIESNHVYIHAGFQYFIQQNPSKTKISVFENGLGTGLNFLRTADSVSNLPNLTVDYWALEPYFVRKSILSQLNYADFLSDSELFESYLEAWNDIQAEKLEFNRNNIQLTAFNQSLQDFETNRTFDVIYFDAFSASTQPEMWDYESLERISRKMYSGSVAVTYAVRGPIKRAFKELGCEVERLKGPPGKSEMLRATKI